MKNTQRIGKTWRSLKRVKKLLYEIKIENRNLVIINRENKKDKHVCACYRNITKFLVD